MADLSGKAIEQVPNMPRSLRAGFHRALSWYQMNEMITLMVAYQTHQKQKVRYGALPSFLCIEDTGRVVLYICIIYNNSFKQCLKTIRVKEKHKHHS